MKDMVTNGTGNSRYLKTSLASGTTWESALAMLREGTFPIDLNGLNNGGITQLGSAYSKANVLPDDVCALLGLNSTTAEPKDAFNVVGNPAELWVWEKNNYTPASYHDGETHTNEIIVRKGDSASRDIFYYSDSISVDVSGAISLTNPSELYLSYDNYSSASVLKGKYIRKESFSQVASQVAFIPTTATFSRRVSSGNDYFVQASTLTYIVGVKPVFSHVEYVSSPNSSTYPENGQSGDYWYTRLGQIGGAARIETGSYVGTGTYGSSNPNSVTFGFKPKIIFWFLTPNVTNEYALDYTSFRNVITPIEFFTTEYKAYKKPYLYYDNASSGYAKISEDGKTISWYHTYSADQQSNISGTKYYYVAIG